MFNPSLIAVPIAVICAEMCHAQYMARWLMFGCFGFLLFLGVGGWAFYNWLVRPVQALVNDFRQVTTLDQKVEKQTPYTPAGEQLSPRQLERFLKVQRSVKDQLGERYQRLEARLNQLATQSQGKITLDYRSALDLFRDSGSLIVDAKKLQVQALNQQGFSAEEYRWVRNQIYGSLGLGIPKIDTQEILRQIGNGDFNPKVDLLNNKPIPANTRLVEPYRNELTGYYPFTWFSL